MRERILEELKRVESEFGVRILYCVESGSRAWGFESTDSDWDVRFIYAHPTDWYLSVSEKRDVIEKPITDVLDVSGWDLRKALRLFKKSNPPLLEWLRSPIIYRDDFDFAQDLRGLGEQFFSPITCMYHYLHMGKKNYREYLKADMVKIKKYFYVLRPIMACGWIENRGTPPPVEFEKLVQDQIESPELNKIIRDLVERKRAGEELSLEPRIPELNNYIDERIEYFDRVAGNTPASPKKNFDLLDEFMRNTLQRAWNN